MRIARYELDGRSHYGVLDGQTVRRLAASPFQALALSGETDDAARIRLLAPVERPRVFGVGFNYTTHIKEIGHELPKMPCLFMKPSTAVIGPEQPIVYPRQGKEVHYEGELAVIIGKGGRGIPEKAALDAVLGYSCANDVSERSIQFAEMDMGCLLIGKGFDSFCPIGPVIATDIDPADLDLTTRLNGELRQHGNTSDLLFSVRRLVSYLSEAITLLPGDVIITGTPAGVGPIRPGDVVKVEIEQIGLLRNPVIAAAV